MTGELPRKEAETEHAVLLDIVCNPVPQLDGELRLRDCPQLWDLMMECWSFDPALRPTALPRSVYINPATRPPSRPYQAIHTTTEAGSRNAVVDEVFEKLKSFQVDHSRIVFPNYDRQEGGFGVVQRAYLFESAPLASQLVLGIGRPPQLVAAKQMKISKMPTDPRKKRPFPREMLVWATLPDHPGIAKFLGFCDFTGSEAWLLSPWEPNGNVSQFIKAHELSVPQKLSLVRRLRDTTAVHQPANCRVLDL
ncbi:hypothetical protein FRC00_001796 [Tulasnella sp. 408]|nr:hypothetical protein FRC00_001796 [Tulasnella sp. 408]